MQQQPPTASKAIATDPQQRSTAEVQTTDRADAAVQATAGPHGTSTKARVDAASLSAFLEHAGSSMLSELAANVDYAAGRSRHTRKAGSEVRHCSWEWADCAAVNNLAAAGAGLLLLLL
jgi:hypothetical protein